MNTSLEDRLRSELKDEAGGLEPRAGYVTSTVHTVLARRRRRQLGTVAAAVAAVAVIATGGITLDTQADDDGAPATPADSPTPSEPAPIQPTPPLDFADIQRIPPQQQDWESLPWRDTALPRVLPSDVAAAPALSQDPIDHALALVAGPNATVGVVGDDGRLRRLDGVALEPTRDSSGYRSPPVSQGSLTPDGRRAAFPQPDAVVVVDLSSGSAERFDVPGPNSQVLWHPDQRQVLVGRENGPSSLVDTIDGSVEDAPYDAYDTAYASDGTAYELTDRYGVGPPTLVRWEGDVDRDRVELEGLGHSADTPPSVTDDHLVVAGSVDDVDPAPQLSRTGEGWIVLDIDDGNPVSMLKMPQAWYESWSFGPTGWLDADTVLLTAPNGLVAWTPDTGALERVTETDSYFDLSLATDALG